MKKNLSARSDLSAIVLASILTLSLTDAYAQTKHSAKGPRTSASATKATAAPPAPTGPVGIGALKIGMTQSAVEALTAADGIYAVEPLAVDTQQNATAGDGAARYTTRMMTPLDASKSSRVRLTFRDDKLSGFSIEIDDSPFDQALAQLSSKYGSGEFSDDRKDEQCVYRNGANFKVNSGSVTHRWTQRISDREQIKAAAVAYTIAFCPPSLSGPSLDPTTAHFISISDVQVDPTPKPNPF
ncbi:hypothetical protein LMG27952_03115 [Paraburkholderia hiiakae]|uniref:Uncharacterized protein n=1 Tax=Paraburkholderia hiiakae TaxID=1081782 RepID=A0ABN7HTB1_9BURK|nr:hypothetical protein [Paraburkholderia hiiakae]CAD6536179.1 hypothetical protein LMG27952_03115 [Paraburkholderia hiiakae]